MPDLDVALPTWPDIGRHPKLKTTANEPQVIMISRCRPMSGHVNSAISESGMVENVGVTGETAAPALSVQKLFPLPVIVADIQVGRCSRCRPMTGRVGSAICDSGMVENAGVAVETASPAHSVQRYFHFRFL